MKRRNILLVCLFVLILSLSVFVVACDTSGENETTETAEVTTDTSGATDDTASIKDGDTTDVATGDRGESDTDVDSAELQIPFDSLEETEGEETEATVDPDACKLHPNGYDFDTGYHWYPACESCGRTEASTPRKHTAYSVIEDEGDVIVYSYFCVRCDCTISRIEVPYDVNLYIDPIALSEATHNFGTTAADFDSTYGIPAMQFTSENGSGNYIMAYSDDNTAAPSGQWIAIKIKLGDGRASFRIDISSMEGKKSQTTADGVVTATFTELHAGWTTVIVDASKIVDGDAGYLPSGDGKYYLNQLKLRIDGAAAMQKDEHFDIAYIAFFDTLDDAKSFAADDYARYIFTDVLETPVADKIDGTPCKHDYEKNEVTHSYAACDICKDEGGTFAHRYNFTNVESDEEGNITQYQVKCHCGRESELKTVPDDVNHYTVPSKIYFTNYWHGYTHGEIGYEDGDVYQRVYLSGDANGAGGTIPLMGTGDTDKFATLKNGSGKYFVFKIRTHEIDVIGLRLATRAEGDLFTQPAQGHPNAQTGWTKHDGEWMTVVVDLRRLAATGLASQVSQYIVDDDSISKASVGFMCQKTGGNVEGYMDIAYFAICDTWEQIAEITGEEKVLVTAWAGNAPMAEATTDGNISCEEHIPKLFVSEDRKTYSFKCWICDKEYDTKTFTTDVNYYSAPSQQVNNYASGGTGTNNARPGVLMFDEEGGFVYNRITLEKGGSFEFINESTPKDKYLKGFNEVHDTIDGSGKYMVIKMRVGTEDFIKLLAWDGVTGNETYFINGEFKNDAVLDLTNRNTALNADWTVYVIDMEKAFPATYDADNADITNATFGLKGDFDGGDTDYVDIAYLAICDGWDEIADVVGEDDDIMLYTDWKTPFSDELRKTDGSVTTLPECDTHASIAVDTMTANGVTTYRYSCPDCRYIFSTKTVSTDINYYAAPSAKIGLNNWNTGEKTSSYGYVGELDIYKNVDTVFPYARVTIQNGGSFEINGGSANEKGFDTADDSIGGSGNFVVVKMRVGTGAQEFLKMFAWDGQTGNDDYYYFDNSNADESKWTWKLKSDAIFDKSSRTELSTDWVVYVIDISKAFGNTYTAGNKDISSASFGFKGDGNGGSLNGTEWTGYDENDYIDIAYFAVCDDWTEIANVVGDENVVLTDWKTPANDKDYTSAGVEILPDPCPTHEAISQVKEVGATTTEYKLVCTDCKHTLDSKVISNDVNYYVAPNSKALYNSYNASGKGGLADYCGALEFIDGANEDFSYMHVTLQTHGAFETLNGTAQIDWTKRGFNTVDETVAGSGKYIVMKIRVGSNEGAIKLLAWDGITGKDTYYNSTDSTLNSDSVFGLCSRTTNLSTDWVTYVIDISKAFPNTYDAENSSITKATFGIRGDADGDDDANDYIDVAYFAVCDNWTEIASVVGSADATVTLTDWKTPGNDSNVKVSDKIQDETPAQ